VCLVADVLQAIAHVVELRSTDGSLLTHLDLEVDDLIAHVVKLGLQAIAVAAAHARDVAARVVHLILQPLDVRAGHGRLRPIPGLCGGRNRQHQQQHEHHHLLHVLLLVAGLKTFFAGSEDPGYIANQIYRLQNTRPCRGQRCRPQRFRQLF
jgi:hypothetical protein